MTVYLVHDSAGRILRSGNCLPADLTHQAGPGETALAAAGRDDLHWIDGGVVTDRPVTGLPATHSVAANTDWPVPDVPEGTEVLIDGAAAGTVDGDGLTLNFPDAGVWRVRLLPPFPWRPADCVVTVT
jgi:hypothetical protein